MSYEILLADGAVLSLQISATTYKTWSVWKIKFTDSHEVMLYKCGNEWVQRNEDQLDEAFIIAIGQHIDGLKLTVQ